MLRSMTAFGRAESSGPLGTFSVEIQSVNRKFLEVNVYLPKELSFLETEIKGWVAEEVTRGAVTVRITALYQGASPVAVKPNLPLVRQIKSAAEEIARALDIKDKESLALKLLSNSNDVLIYTESSESEEPFRQILKETIKKALEPFSEMKKFEGEKLYNDFKTRCNLLTNYINEIVLKSVDAPKRLEEKLKAKIEEVSKALPDNEERLLREIALFAEKVDITEEITRFRSHLDHFSKVLASHAPSVGKTAEFILQEFFREINTIGSKSSEVAIARIVVEAKSEIERMREQVQNVE